MKGFCKIDGCEKKVKAKGLCSMHHQRWWRNGDPLFLKQQIKKICKEEGCGELAKCKGYCTVHYARWRKYGDPQQVRQVIATCTVEGCDKKHRARGMCASHYQIWSRRNAAENRKLKALKPWMTVPAHPVPIEVVR
ncbi:hypothetical protein J31TS4_31830 [Paenibacillus sp. J31TS4]|uniref:hypothetical protein n=1 Tax=Paenibacillus sp. J31TS4 TaxID=2807195 RepID=UPI001B09A6A5|nr:hypothetical protein [Paenibacillus sp. J31TS4]GIP39903.1 hypothetical protein J31TS4_31830 [Paenibacillus sp. J31TS4]